MVDFPFPVRHPALHADGRSEQSARPVRVTTTLNALVPGAIKEGKRAIWAARPVQVYDGGPDGDVGTAPNTAFARPGHLRSLTSPAVSGVSRLRRLRPGSLSSFGDGKTGRDRPPETR